MQHVIYYISLQTKSEVLRNKLYNNMLMLYNIQQCHNIL